MDQRHVTAAGVDHPPRIDVYPAQASGLALDPAMEPARCVVRGVGRSSDIRAGRMKKAPADEGRGAAAMLCRFDPLAVLLPRLACVVMAQNLLPRGEIGRLLRLRLRSYGLVQTPGLWMSADRRN